jgi:hypothetical protein
MAEKSTLTDYMDICDGLSRQLDREKKLHRQANIMRLQQMDRDSEEITRLRRQNQELRDALKPFAAIHINCIGSSTLAGPWDTTPVVVLDRHIQAARAAIASQEATGEARTAEDASGATCGPE